MVPPAARDRPARGVGWRAGSGMLGVVFGAIGRFCARRRRLVLAAWVVLVAGGAVASGPVFAGLESSRASDRLESVRAFDVIGNNATYGSRVLGLVDDVPIADPAVKARIEAAAADVARVPHVGRVVDPYKGVRAGLIATDGRAGVVVVDLDRTISGTERDAAIDAASARLRQLDREIPGATVKIGGTPLLNREINDQVKADTERAEAVSLPITLIVMVGIFGGVLAALLPLVGAIAAVGGAFLCLLGFAAVIRLDPNTEPVTTLLGLGISIDYALLMVSRFREERAAGADVPGAVERTAATAGRTIAFSALTVAVSLSALMIFDDPTFRAIGAAGVAVVVVALLAALTLVPALLALVGGRIPVRRALAPPEGFFSRLARAVQRRAAGLAGRDRRRRAAARGRHAAAVAEAGERRGEPAAGLVRGRAANRTSRSASPAPARIPSPCWRGRRRSNWTRTSPGLASCWTGPTWPRWLRRHA